MSGSGRTIPIGAAELRAIRNGKASSNRPSHGSPALTQRPSNGSRTAKPRCPRSNPTRSGNGRRPSASTPPGSRARRPKRGRARPP